MESNQSKPSDLTPLINSLLNEVANDAQRQQLESALQGNPAAIEHFLEYCEMHIDLSVDMGADRAMESFFQRRQEGAASVTPASGPQVSLFGQVSSRARHLSSAMLWGGLACGLAFIAGGIWWTARFNTVAELPEKSDAVAPPSAFAATSITLPSGSSTRMHFDKVGYATIHGPANFQLINPMRARLEQGRIRMRVTEKTGHGFVVETPDGDITDLGTEFGVEVTTGKSSALAVFEGAVDLQVADQKLAKLEKPRIERLLGGDGVLFNKGGQTTRLNSILTGSLTAFSVCSESSESKSSEVEYNLPLIVDMYDNLPADKTRRYYEIVPGGMQEDTLAFVDRLQHNWNGLSRGLGLPKDLREADYVKTFCDDKLRTDSNFKLTVVLGRPAKLFVLYDKRLEPPQWLTEAFTKTEGSVGLDMGKWYSLDEPPSPSREIGAGPGQSIDLEFAVWERIVHERGSVKLGPNGKNPITELRATMYGIAAVEFPLVVKEPVAKPKKKPKQKNARQTVQAQTNSKNKDN